MSDAPNGIEHADNKDCEDDESESVYLIASGYEWECPNCDKLNEEIEITQRVTCRKCKRTYPVDGADHAWE
jgi:predicted RNA-binding Zn-ribbon protein involved in translation (DUF1610 family)